MSLILMMLAVLLSAAGLFYYIQTRRVQDSQREPPPGAANGKGEFKTDRIPSRRASAQAAAASAVQAQDRRDSSALQGNLAETPLHDFLQYLSLGRKAGILELASGRRTGRMVFQGGKVYKASFRGKEGLDAVFQMLDLPEGDFEFHEQSLDEVPAQHPLEVVDVIMLWMDRKPKKKPITR